jgi:hypothetical protein
MELTRLVSRETFLEAVFLWMIPFRAALSIADMASFKAVPAVSLFSATALSTFLHRVFSFVLRDLFFSVRVSVCRTLFMADIFFLTVACAGNVLPPYDFNFQSCSME